MTPIHSTRLFDYDSKAQTFFAEASELPRPITENASGFFLKSHKTGTEVLFLFKSEEHDNTDGEIMSWTFEQWCLHPGQTRKMQAVIWND
jgi:hypothetical protein